MRDTWFWRAVAVAAVAGLFYVGAGLAGHSSATPIENVAHGDIVIPENHLGWTAITSSPDGKTLYFYGHKGRVYIDKDFAYLGKLEATP
jgi:hypothetical protein